MTGTKIADDSGGNGRQVADHLVRRRRTSRSRGRSTETNVTPGGSVSTMRTDGRVGRAEVDRGDEVGDGRAGLEGAVGGVPGGGGCSVVSHLTAEDRRAPAWSPSPWRCRCRPPGRGSSLVTVAVFTAPASRSKSLGMFITTVTVAVSPGSRSPTGHDSVGCPGAGRRVDREQREAGRQGVGRARRRGPSTARRCDTVTVKVTFSPAAGCTGSAVLVTDTSATAVTSVTTVRVVVARDGVGRRASPSSRCW